MPIEKLTRLSRAEIGASGMEIAVRLERVFVDTDTNTDAAAPMPHRFVVPADCDVATIVAGVNEHFAAEGWPPIIEADLARINAVRTALEPA